MYNIFYLTSRSNSPNFYSINYTTCTSNFNHVALLRFDQLLMVKSKEDIILHVFVTKERHIDLHPY